MMWEVRLNGIRVGYGTEKDARRVAWDIVWQISHKYTRTGLKKHILAQADEMFYGTQMLFLQGNYRVELTESK